MARDPVCGMEVDPRATNHRHIHSCREYAFCSATCLAKLRDDPQRHLAPSAPPAAPAGTVCSCPMHPQVRQCAPGSRPICGMALEPLTPGAEAGPSPGLRDMTRRMLTGGR